MKPVVWAFISLLSVVGVSMHANSTATQASLANATTSVTLALPGAGESAYRGTRFDWSGIISRLESQGHTWFGPWFAQMDPSIHDFTYSSSGIIAGPCTAVTGPVEEFTAALGYQEAAVGGTFVKIGVGVLRKPSDAKYDSFHLYEIVDPGQWHVSRRRNMVEFQQEVGDSSSGFAYEYSKTVRLSEREPMLTIDHQLKNTGKHAIETDLYDHNFLVIDGQAPGPDTTIHVPFKIAPVHPPESNLAEFTGNHIRFLRELSGEDRVYGSFHGFGTSSRDYDIRIENTRVGGGLRIKGDRPLSNVAAWAIRSVVAVEPFIKISIDPGKAATWRYQYSFYKLDSSTH